MSTMKLRVQNGTMEVYLGAPNREAPGPAVVLMYHRGGVDDFTKLAVNRLVLGGYLVAVPDVYHPCPPDMPARERKDLLKDSEIVSDVEATIAALRHRPDVDPDKLAVMGHCMGGRMAFLVASNVDVFRGAVIYYGGGVMRPWGEGPPPFDMLKNIRCPVLGFFGNEDKNPSPEDVNRIDGELSRHGIAHEFHRYDRVGHGFQNPAHDSADERAAAEDAWTKTFAFLKRVTAPSP
jgi:carboxymethylenebutenolidase